MQWFDFGVSMIWLQKEQFQSIERSKRQFLQSKVDKRSFIMNQGPNLEYSRRCLCHYNVF